MTTKKTGHPTKSTPHDSIIIDTVHYASNSQHGRIDAGLAALLALGVVAVMMLMGGRDEHQSHGARLGAVSRWRLIVAAYVGVGGLVRR